VRVYISGPMLGYPNNNYPAFTAVENEITSHGLDGRDYPPDVTVLNPAKNFGGDQQQPRASFMQLALEQALSADIIVQLPGWQDSDGAWLEAQMGLTTGKRFYEASWRNFGSVRQPDLRWGFSEVPAEPDRTAVSLSAAA
jgi:uncharacterized protein DUF4406